MALQRTGVCHGREEIRSLLYPNDRGDRGPCDGSARVKDGNKFRSLAAHVSPRMGGYEEHPENESRPESADKKRLVRPERFELPTLWFEAKCSIQLSYGRGKQGRT